MSQLGNVPEIIEIKEHLNELKKKQLISEWELPYENILTRHTAAIFFLTPTDKSNLSLIWKELAVYEGLKYFINEDKKLSSLTWRFEFNA